MESKSVLDMRYTLPKIFKVESVQDYLKEFLNLNSTRRGFSQRSFAKKIKWPISYISDVQRKRKNFSIKRALEFASFHNLSPLDYERLIYFSLLDSGLLKTTEFSKVFKSKKPTLYSPTVTGSLLDMNVLIIFESIRWLKGTATLEALNQLLSERGIPYSEIIRTTLLLTEKGYIKKEISRYYVLQEYIMSDDSKDLEIGKKLHQQFMSSIIKFVEQPYGPADYNSCIVTINRERFHEIADRIRALRNWILELSTLDSQLQIEEDVRLFQLDMNFTPIFKKDTCLKFRTKK